MSHTYKIKQNPLLGLLVTSIFIGLACAVTLFFVYLSSGESLYYVGLLLGFAAIAITLFLPSLHAWDLFTDIPELEEHVNNESLSEAHKIKHPLIWLILPINSLWLLILLWFAYEDITPENNGYFVYYGSIVLPVIVSTLISYMTVTVKVPKELQEIIEQVRKTSAEK